MKTKREKIVVTGLGAVSPAGCEVGKFWENLIAGRSFFRPVTSFDTAGHRTSVGSEATDFDEGGMREGGLTTGARATAMAADAAGQALAQAGFPQRRDQRVTGVCLGTTMGEIGIIERHLAHEASPEGERPDAPLSDYPCSVIPRGVADLYGLGGPNLMVPTACAAGNYAIGIGRDLLLRGEADVMVVGGVDPYSRVAHTGFNRLFAVAPDVCRPFDAGRKGIIPGEGAGVLVLEKAAHARERGAVVLAEVLGYGLSCDAFHITNPDPAGEGLLRAMESAVRDSGIEREAIDYISAHGTGTPANDAAESAAVGAFLGPRTREVPVSSIKSMIGHTMGAASALEAVASVMALRTGKIPPTMNHESPDPKCDIDCVPNESRDLAVNTVLSNSMAFGGNNACLVLGRYEG